MKLSQVNFVHDRQSDVMYLFKAKPRRGKSIEVSEDFILRLDPITGEVIGLTIIVFSRHFPLFRSARKRRLPRRGTFSPQAFFAGVTATTP